MRVFSQYWGLKPGSRSIKCHWIAVVSVVFMFLGAYSIILYSALVIQAGGAIIGCFKLCICDLQWQTLFARLGILLLQQFVAVEPFIFVEIRFALWLVFFGESGPICQSYRHHISLMDDYWIYSVQLLWNVPGLWGEVFMRRTCGWDTGDSGDSWL